MGMEGKNSVVRIASEVHLSAQDTAHVLTVNSGKRENGGQESRGWGQARWEGRGSTDVNARNQNNKFEQMVHASENAVAQSKQKGTKNEDETVMYFFHFEYFIVYAITVAPVFPPSPPPALPELPWSVPTPLSMSVGHEKLCLGKKSMTSI